MEVSITEFSGAMEVRKKHTRLQVYDNSGDYKGSLYINKGYLIWCSGKTTLKNGKKISWEKFITDMEA
jgi:hypothetical protein